MIQQRFLQVCLTGLAYCLAGVIAMAQANEFILLYASLKIDDTTHQADPRKIEISFGGNFPDEGLLKRGEDWLVEKLNKSGAATPITVGVISPVVIDKRTRVVTLTLTEAVNPKEEQIRIYYRHGDLPSVILDQPRKVKAAALFKAANGKKDADIYFSGTVVTARESKPLYSFESKLGYLHTFSTGGALGAKATVDAAEEGNLDPDSITFSVVYRKILVLRPVTALVLQSELIGGEFDKENRTRNLISKLDGILVLPPKFPSKKSVTSINFLAGFEGGHNYRHKLNENGLGQFWRWKLGSSAYLKLKDLGKLSQLVFSADYVVRLPSEAETFSSVRDGKKTTILTTKARHFVSGNIDFMFTDYFGLALQYRYGSLPPAYNLVNNSVSLGITYQLKQADK